MAAENPLPGKKPDSKRDTGRRMSCSAIVRGAALVALAWYILAFAVSGPIVPYPHEAAYRLFQSFLHDDMYLHLLFSLYRVAGGLFLALFFGIPVGLAAGRNRALDGFISPFLYLLYPLPKIAFLPVFMVLLGIGDASKIVLIAVIIFFPMAVNVRDHTRRITREYGILIEAFHIAGREVIRDILLPGVLPGIFASLRITLGISLSVLFVSENFATTYGLGYSIMNSWIMTDYTGMYAAILLLSLLGLLLYLLLDLMEAFCLPWLRADWQAE